MRTIRFYLFLGVAAVCCLCGLAKTLASQGQAPALLRTAITPPNNMVLPQPPQQHTPWTPPATTMPEEFVTATETLFAQGLADPRGCDYREIDVHVGNCWQGDASMMKVHGWVLPEQEKAPLRFAVCWNGLVYPVESVGVPVDLQADLKTLNNHGDFMAFPESYAIEQSSPMVLKVCLLLRLGEGELATRLLNSVGIGMKKDLYLRLATAWAWARFDRMINAEMRGSDWLALQDARALTALQPLIEEEAAQRGYPRPRTVDENGKDIPKPPYLSFLKPLPAVLADQEQRAKEARPPFSLAAITAQKDQAARITALMQALNEVTARIWVGEDPIVKALIKEGEPAVEPLIDDLASDTRLTRSLVFLGRDFIMEHRPVPVSSAAYTALCAILNTTEFGGNFYVDDPKVTAAHIRVYWEKNKGLTPPERWYRTLIDGTASPDQWLEAAGHMVSRPDITRHGIQWFTVNPSQPGKTAGMHDEPLRKKTNPSVSELMARRALQIADIKTGSSLDEFNLYKACLLGFCLAEWDQTAAIPVLSALMQRARTSYDYNDGLLPQALSRLTQACIACNAPLTINEYADWLHTLKPKQVGNSAVFVLEPLWRYPNDPALSSAADWLFNDPASPWSSLFTDDISLQPEYLFTAEMLGLPAFRRHLLTALADKRVIGTYSTRKETGNLIILHWANGGEMDISNEKAPNFTTPQPLRRCDVYGYFLKGVEMMPATLAFCDTEAQRDAALAAMAAFVKQYGAR